LQGEGYLFFNAGRDGEVAYNALQRLDQVVSLNPDTVVVLLGANDVNAVMPVPEPRSRLRVSERNTRRYVRGARLPQEPSLEWFKENMERILRALEERTRARLAVLSLPVLGEDLEHPANLRAAAYSAVIKDVAEASGVSYLPLHERQVQYLRQHPSRDPRAFGDGLGLVLAAAARRLLLRQSWERISRSYRLQLTTDTIHLNDRGGKMVAELVEAFLRNAAPPEAVADRSGVV
jgi:lysophospholipase L1-like esterase